MQHTPPTNKSNKPNNAVIYSGREAYNPITLQTAIASIGYKPEEATADICDNAIEAGASVIEVAIHPQDGSKYLKDATITIADNGSGMTSGELCEAMRLGTERERDFGNEKALGEFGLGMKAASLSLGDSLTVLSAQKGRYVLGHISCDLLREANDLAFWATPPNEYSEVANQLSEEIIVALGGISGGNVDTFTGTIISISNLSKVKKSCNAKSWATSLFAPLGTIFSKMISTPASHGDLTFTVNYNGKNEPFSREVRPVTLQDLNPASEGYEETTWKKGEFITLKVGEEQVRVKVTYFSPPGRGKTGGQKTRGQGVRLFKNRRLMNMYDPQTFGVWGKNDVFTGFYVDLLIPNKTSLVSYNVQKARPEMDQSLVRALKDLCKLPLAHVRKRARIRAAEREADLIRELDTKLSENSERFALDPQTRKKIDESGRTTRPAPQGRGKDKTPRKPKSCADYGYEWTIATKSFEFEVRSRRFDF